MTTILRWLVPMAIILLFSIPSASAGWKNRVADNEEKAAEYISQLKAGMEPGSIERPQMRHINTYKAKQRQTILNKAMDEAEELARSGKHDEIQELEEYEIDPAEQTGGYPRRSKSNY